MTPQIIAIIILAVLLLAAVAAAAWLLLERTKLLAEVVRGAAERDQAERSLADVEDRLNQTEQSAAAASTRVSELAPEAARLQERLAERERQYERDVAAIEQRYKERAERDKAQLDELNERFQNAFAQLANKALDSSADRFLKLARESFDKHQQAAEATQDKRHKAFTDLVSPIKETLTKTDERLTSLDKARVQTEAKLTERIGQFNDLAASLSQETSRLVQSLKAPQVRGRWGEMQLRRVVELAGMSAHCDFDTQTSVASESGTQRPDMLIHLPGQRVIVVDAKTPLHAYIESIEATENDQRAARLKAHARQVRDRINELAGKSYQSQFESTPDFTVLFVPGDQFLSAALLEQPDLLEYAASKQIILTTPATLIALLKAVQFGWSQASLAEDAREVLTLGRELHDRVSVLADHLSRIGKGLTTTIEAYNKAVGSYETRLLPAASRMAERNIRTTKSLADANPVTVAPRTPAHANGNDRVLLSESKPVSTDPDQQDNTERDASATQR